MSEIMVDNLPLRHIQIVRNVFLKEGGKAEWHSNWKHLTALLMVYWLEVCGPDST